MYKIAVFIPRSHLEKVKSALFLAGAGKIGNYDSCSFEYEGVGQFRACDGANPFLGKVGKLEKVDEVKVEMVCADHLIKEAILAMKSAHPYETPAYDVFKMEEF